MFPMIESVLCLVVMFPFSEWIEEVQACMRAHNLSLPDQTFFLFDHLEGEAREEIKYRPLAEREDADRILAILQELYGCSKSIMQLYRRLSF